MSKRLETKSEGVKGLSFHIWKAWILASLETGVIQLWDYRMGALIDQFEHHHGPVRGVHFHRSRPLFVSGGDDHKIKVWNYMLRRCMFTLVGHFGKIRTVQFHYKYPWIVSASDDHSIRIWNWAEESRGCVCVLTGHTSSVMSASFHRDGELILSASLDKTIRVWDIGGLVNKTQARTDTWLSPTERHDLESATDASLKFVIRGHCRGVNWAAFHPLITKFIVSGADDHHVKLWRMNDSLTGASLVKTLSGHMSNVSSVLFHKIDADIIVSSSEDGSVIVWEASTWTPLQTFRREHDRFSILASHPANMNLFAAGHDSGMFVFKLERDRPVFSVSGDSMCELANFNGWLLRFFKFIIGKKTNVTRAIRIQRPHCPSFNKGAKMLSYSSTSNAVLICLDVDGGSYELYTIPEVSFGNNDGAEVNMHEAGKGSGRWAVFVDSYGFAVLDNRTNQIFIKNLKNETIEKSPLPVVTDAIFYAGTGNLLCRAENRVFIFNLKQRIIVGELQNSFVRYVVWSNDLESVALLSKNSIVIASKKLVHQCTLHEKMRIKSGAWDDNGVFIYSTLNHIKYCLPNGDSGIIKSVNFSLFITKASGSIVHGLDVEGRVKDFKVDATEYLIKLYLLKKRYGQVMSMLRSSEFYRHTVMAYLQQKGLSEVAFHFAKDEKTRFNLALENGYIQVAVASAKVIDDKNHWYRLGVEALHQGNVGIAKYAFKRTKNFKSLSFLYLVTGNLDKLSRMQNIAKVGNDVMGKFHNALYVGDIRERVQILENTGNLYLAYVTAAVHGLHETAERLAVALGDKFPCLPSGKSFFLLVPPRPIILGGDWPLLRVMRGRIKGGPENVGWNTEESEEAAHTNHRDGFDIIADDENFQDGDVCLAEDGEVSDCENDERGCALEDLDLLPKTDLQNTARKCNACSMVYLTPFSGMPTRKKGAIVQTKMQLLNLNRNIG